MGTIVNVTLVAACLFLGITTSVFAVDIAGNIEFEVTGYEDEGQFDEQDYRSNLSIAAEPEFYWEWDNGNNSLVFTPFFRID